MKIYRKSLLLFMVKYGLSIIDLADILRLYSSIVESMLIDSIIELDEEQAKNFIQCFGVADSIAMMKNPNIEVIKLQVNTNEETMETLSKLFIGYKLAIKITEDKR